VLKSIHPSIIITTAVLVPAIAYTVFIGSIFATTSHLVASEPIKASLQPISIPASQPPAAPLSTDAPAPVVAAPVASPATTTSSTTIAPSSYTGKYSAEMTVAGIAESDKPLVASLMLNGDQWAAVNLSPMSREIHSIYDPTQRIGYANFYVKERWVTWQAAVDFAQAHQGNW
jgi:hypothetical protein